MTDRRRTSLAVYEPRAVALNGHDDSAALTAAGMIIPPDSRANLLFRYERWQDEVWDYLDTIGEFGYGHWWLAQAVSRVRLVAAVRRKGEAEPEIMTDGPAADLMAEISNPENNEAFGLHVPLVGKCYLVGQREPLVGMKWSVKSGDEVRPARGARARSITKFFGGTQSSIPTGRFEIQIMPGLWEPIDGMVAEIRHPHPRFGWLSISQSKSAIPILREIALYDKHIIATLVSRLGMNGLLLIPDEATFVTNPQFKDAPDPFVADLIDIFSRNIKNPGTASAAMPYPLRMNGDLIDKVKHMPFSTPIDEHIVENRKLAIERLATTINVSRERLTGMGDVNHWGAWEIKDDEVSQHVVPPVELVCQALTKTYLRPFLAAAGESLYEDGDEIIAWYDAGELVQKPDLSENADKAFMNGVMARDSYVRHLGFEESDMPNDTELTKIILLRQALAPGADPTYLQELTGVAIELQNSQAALLDKQAAIDQQAAENQADSGSEGAVQKEPPDRNGQTDTGPNARG